MAIRYSGDTEIRLGFDRIRRVYRGSVVDPYLRFRGDVPLAKDENDPTSSAAYDDAAKRLLRAADKWARTLGKRFATSRKGSHTIIDRGFQAPCPLEDL
jgi:hypothetical protein